MTGAEPEHDHYYLPTPWDDFVAGEAAVHAAVAQLLQAIERGDEAAFRSAARCVFHFNDGWNYALCKIVRDKPHISRAIRRQFLNIWAWSGRTIRHRTVDDGLLADGLRVMLGGYCGPSRRLYRGQDEREKIGVCWTMKRKVASLFGGTILETVAPPDAIISTIPSCGWPDGKYSFLHEFLVDPRLLPSVRIVATSSFTAICIV